MNLEADTGTRVDTERLIQLRHLTRNFAELTLKTTGRPGGFKSKRRGSGLETLDVRAFSDGDDFRRIDAMTTARTGKLHVRTYHDDQEKTALLVADFRPSMFWGTRRRLRSVAAAELLALAGWRIVDNGGKLGLLTISAGETRYAPSKLRDIAMAHVSGSLSRAHNDAMDALLRGQVNDPPLDERIEQAGKLLPTGGSLVLATGFDAPGQNIEAVLSALERRIRIVVYLVRDAFEVAPPPGRYPYFSNDQRSGRAILGSRTRALKPDPRATRLRKLGIEVRSINSSEELSTMFAAMGGVDD